MDQNTPVIFSDGTSFFDNLANSYTKHTKGYFILAPSGSGKTHFMNRQTSQDWIDGDYLWPRANADLTDSGWDVPHNTVIEVNNKSDVITNEAVKLGFWIIGSSNSWLKPDAIVLPEWSTHEKYIRYREHTNYDGGAKAEDLEAVKSHRRWISKWKKEAVPCFDSVEKAVTYLQNLKD